MSTTNPEFELKNLRYGHLQPDAITHDDVYFRYTVHSPEFAENGGSIGHSTDLDMVMGLIEEEDPALFAFYMGMRKFLTGIGPQEDVWLNMMEEEGFDPMPWLVKAVAKNFEDVRHFYKMVIKMKNNPEEHQKVNDVFKNMEQSASNVKSYSRLRSDLFDDLFKACNAQVLKHLPEIPDWEPDQMRKVKDILNNKLMYLVDELLDFEWEVNNPEEEEELSEQ